MNRMQKLRRPGQVSFWGLEFHLEAVVGALLAALVALAGASCSKPRTESNGHNQAEAIVVTVARAETVRWDRAIPIVGTLYPKDEATIAAEVEGRVEKTQVDFGDRVKEGQELAQIDTKTYEALANQAAANLARANATAARGLTIR